MPATEEREPSNGCVMKCHRETKLRNGISSNGTSNKSTIGDYIMDKGERFKSLPVRELHEKFLRDVSDIVLEDAIFEGTSRENPVLKWTDPKTLENQLDFRLPSTGLNDEELVNIAKRVIEFSVKTGHPRFVNQLFSTVDPYGFAGQLLTDALNPSVYTYEVSPVFSLMEEEVLREMRRIVGYENGEGDGLFCPGGSMANGYAINLARHCKFPDIKEEGQHEQLQVFTSEDAHYSVKKLAAFLGIGTKNVILIPVDDKGKMRVSELEREIEKSLKSGRKPLMVSATAGTTVIGAFDPLVDIAQICRKYELWFHVDAAWGGGALLSRRHRSLLDGVELADSVTWNPHKLLAAPQQCSTLLLRQKGLLKSAHQSQASYLFQSDKFYDTSYDSGDKHVQCGRRADVLKFWFMWKAKGTSGLERHIDRVFELSNYFRDLITKRPGFELILEPECTNVCFYYLPPSIRGLERKDQMRELQRIAPVVKERMMRKGSMMIGYQPLRTMPNFFRLVMQNSGLTEQDMHFFVEEIERLAEDL